MRKGTYRYVFLIKIARFSQFSARPIGTLIIHADDFLFVQFFCRVSCTELHAHQTDGSYYRYGQNLDFKLQLMHSSPIQSIT